MIAGYKFSPRGRGITKVTLPYKLNINDYSFTHKGREMNELLGMRTVTRAGRESMKRTETVVKGGERYKQFRTIVGKVVLTDTDSTTGIITKIDKNNNVSILWSDGFKDRIYSFDELEDFGIKIPMRYLSSEQLDNIKKERNKKKKKTQIETNKKKRALAKTKGARDIQIRTNNRRRSMRLFNRSAVMD